MVVGISRIEINHIFHAMRRESGGKPFPLFAERVYHTNTLAVLNVLNNHVKRQGRLTCAGLTKNINMLASVFALDTKKNIFVPIGTDAKIRQLFILRYFR